MTEHRESRYTEDVQEYLQQVQHLLDKHALVEPIEHQPEAASTERHELVDKLLHKRHLTELREIIGQLHPADIAYILEAMPIEQRLLVWDLVKAEHEGKILIEVSGAIRGSLIATMSREELRAAVARLDTDEIADLAPDLPQAAMRDVIKSISIEGREQLRATMSYPEDSVGALMDFNLLHIREDVTLEAVSRYLRRFDKLSEHTDQVFVLDRNDHFKGVLPINLVVVNEPEVKVSQLMITGIVTFYPDDKAEQAAQSFERYDLVSAAVLDEDNKLLGRLTISAIADFTRASSESGLLNLAGLNREEDIFASVWKSVQNRWLWLALNLCAAFIVSRVISNFEGSIEKLVALAALMPIVAAIAANAANQTSTIMIRSMARGQINKANARRLLSKELSISTLNGVVWGGMAGLFAYFFYHNVWLGLVLAGAMVLSLVLGAVIGLLIPLVMRMMGRAPSVGSSVLLTAIASSGGVFILLGLAAVFLIQ